MILKCSKSFFSIIGIVLVFFLISTFFVNESNLSEKEILIEEINFSADSSKNISDLYMYEKFEPDIYFCLGITKSKEIYVGYEQVRKAGITTNGSESLYLTRSTIFKKDYFCFTKTEKEGKFYFGFVDNKDIDSVNINGQSVSVEYFNYPDSSEDIFGFWYIKTDYNYSINNFSY